MKAMKLGDVRRVMIAKGIPFAKTYENACKLANPGDPFLRNMTVALSMHAWLNTDEDWRRLEAALMILAHKRSAAIKRLQSEE